MKSNSVFWSTHALVNTHNILSLNTLGYGFALSSRVFGRHAPPMACENMISLQVIFAC